MQYIVPTENQIAEVVELVYAIKRGKEVSAKANFGGQAGPFPQQVRLVVWNKFQFDSIFIKRKQ